MKLLYTTIKGCYWAITSVLLLSLICALYVSSTNKVLVKDEDTIQVFGYIALFFGIASPIFGGLMKLNLQKKIRNTDNIQRKESLATKVFRLKNLSGFIMNFPLILFYFFTSEIIFLILLFPALLLNFVIIRPTDKSIDRMIQEGRD